MSAIVLYFGFRFDLFFCLADDDDDCFRGCLVEESDVVVVEWCNLMEFDVREFGDGVNAELWLFDNIKMDTIAIIA